MLSTGSTLPALQGELREEELISDPEVTNKTDSEIESTSFFSTFQEVVFILIIGLSQLFSVDGLGNTAYSMEQIGTPLGTNSNAQLSWLLASYSLSGGVFVLVTGRLGDHSGHKYVFLFGWVWMAIWSLVYSFARNIIVFDIARGMMGVGNGALVSNSFALLARNMADPRCALSSGRYSTLLWLCLQLTGSYSASTRGKRDIPGALCCLGHCYCGCAETQNGSIGQSRFDPLGLFSTCS